MSSDEDSQESTIGSIESMTKSDKYYEIHYDTGEQARLYILNSHVFRFYMSPSGKFLDYPEPINPEDEAKIILKTMDEYDSTFFDNSIIEDTDLFYVVLTDEIGIFFDKIQGTMNIRDDRTNKQVLNESDPLSYSDNKVTQRLYQNKQEYFFGGGMQNGRFTHKGEMIKIENTNIWTDGGVTSPCPFYWSSSGYGILRNTWQPGIYDFGFQSEDTIKTIHAGEDFDAFYFINSLPQDILADYYELTGRPIFMPEYAFYEAHMNTFNRDYWVKVDPSTKGGVLFEDGYYYKKYQPDQIDDKSEAILESLNGENNNYQFSARAMIDRYKNHDMPLGWFIPNDGYGSGYGQTDTLDGDIENLKDFGDYARSQGVELALWTESNLEPVDPEKPKKGDRDLNKEIEVAKTVALKCDVAWIGEGYSFALNAVERAAKIFEKATKANRKMIIMVDGWAGTQRHSGIWSGDQHGGQWEYIRFHIPTYIGAGLSGLPVIGSDMDGIFGGGKKNVHIRDYQWKAFTPLQLNMDGWGHKAKTPFAFDEEARDINRAYLKLKSMLLPYNYSLGYEATRGLPMVRAMFLQFPYDNFAYTVDTQYQYMWGPNLLVAPIYNDDCDKSGPVRHGIYLPDKKQVWMDLFTGEKYRGGKVLNNIKVPLWKIPVFVKDGAIIPMTNPNNNPNEVDRDNRIFNIYPSNSSSFIVYEDNGVSSDYLSGHYSQTKIEVQVVHALKGNSDLYINIEKAKGFYKEMVKERTTMLRIMASSDVDYVKVAVNGESIDMTKAEIEYDFDNKENVYYFDDKFILNPYMKQFGGNKLLQKYLLIKIQKFDVSSSHIHIKVVGLENDTQIFGNQSTVNIDMEIPSQLSIVEEETTPTSLSLHWKESPDADYYELERDGAVFTNITDNMFVFTNFKYMSKHSFRIRSVNEHGVSEWSNYIEAYTKEDPYKYTVKGVTVECNFPCQPNEEVSNLVDEGVGSIWHTHYSNGQANCAEHHFIKLIFDLGDIYNIKKVVYVPRDDAGNGTILEINYKISIDGDTWYEMTENIQFRRTKEAKTIMLNGSRFRYMEISIVDSVADFGSGKHFYFFIDTDLND